MQLVVDVRFQERLELEQAADRRATAQRRFVDHHRGEVAARRPSRYHDPLRVTPEVRQFLGEEPDRFVRVRHDLVHGRVGSQRISDHCDADAGAHEALGQEGEIVFRPHLPEAAVDEDEDRRVASRGKIVDPVAGARPVGEIQVLRMLRAELLAAGDPLLEHRAALRHRGRIVVGPIERSAIESLPGLGLRSGRRRSAAEQRDCERGDATGGEGMTDQDHRVLPWSWLGMHTRLRRVSRARSALTILCC